MRGCGGSVDPPDGGGHGGGRGRGGAPARGGGGVPVAADANGRDNPAQSVRSLSGFLQLVPVEAIDASELLVLDHYSDPPAMPQLLAHMFSVAGPLSPQCHPLRWTGMPVLR
jgi:hypothetical protein